MGVDALSITYNDIRIPALNNWYQDGDYKKMSTNVQTLYTVDAKDSWNWNDQRAVEAMVKHVDGASYTSGWVPVSIGKTVSFGSKSQVPAMYRIVLRATKTTASEVRYWGTWAY